MGSIRTSGPGRTCRSCNVTVEKRKPGWAARSECYSRTATLVCPPSSLLFYMFDFSPVHGRHHSGWFNLREWWVCIQGWDPEVNNNPHLPHFLCASLLVYSFPLDWLSERVSLLLPPLLFPLTCCVAPPGADRRECSLSSHQCDSVERILLFFRTITKNLYRKTQRFSSSEVIMWISHTWTFCNFFFPPKTKCKVVYVLSFLAYFTLSLLDILHPPPSYLSLKEESTKRIIYQLQHIGVHPVSMKSDCRLFLIMKTWQCSMHG